MQVTRRNFLMSSAAAIATAAAALSDAAGEEGAGISSELPLRIGMTDWDLGERGNVSKLALAREIGLDGVQVSILYPENGDLHLRCPKLQAEYRQEALDNGVQICSLAIGNLGPGEPFRSEPMGVLRVADAIEVARNLGAHDILLPFFGNMVPDMQNEAEVNRVVNSLKELAPRAEKLGVVIAIETALSSEDDLRIVDRVGSDAIRIYYDPFNVVNYGHDLMKKIPLLKGLIHQVHVKNGNSLLSAPNELGFDWPAVAEALYKIGFDGWYVLETRSPNDLYSDTRANIEYVKKHFRMP